MGMRLVKPSDGSIPARGLHDGQIAEIVQNPNARYMGRVVQQVGSVLVSLGKPKECGFDLVQDSGDKFRVRVLPNGKHEFEITDNE